VQLREKLYFMLVAVVVEYMYLDQTVDRVAAAVVEMAAVTAHLLILPVKLTLEAEAVVLTVVEMLDPLAAAASLLYDTNLLTTQ
jgi:hypothetical protein